MGSIITCDGLPRCYLSVKVMIGSDDIKPLIALLYLLFDRLTSEDRQGSDRDTLIDLYILSDYEGITDNYSRPRVSIFRHLPGDNRHIQKV